MSARETRRSDAFLLPCAAVLLAAGILCGRAMHTPVFALAALLPGGALALLREKRPAAACAVVVLGALLGYAAYHPAVPEEGTYTVTAEVCDEIEQDARGRIRTRLCAVELDGVSVSGGAYWTAYPDPLPQALVPGARVTFTGRVYRPSGAENPGGFDFREYLLGQGMTFGVYGITDLTNAGGAVSLRARLAALRHTLVLRLTDAMGAEAGGYAAAMLLGTKSYLSDSDLTAFRRTGIAHILSVSGFHVGILYAMVLLLLRFLPRRARTAAAAAVLAAYCLLTGGHAPVWRAAIMLLLAAWGKVRHRRLNRRLPLLAASCIVTLLVSPAQLTSAGFLLSYGALFGLTLGLPALERTARRRGAAGKLLGLWCAGICAQLGVLLPQLFFFQELPLLGLLLSPLVMLYASALITADWAVLLVSVLVPGAAPLPGQLTDVMTAGLTAAVRALGRIPGITLRFGSPNLVTALGWGVLLAGLYLLRRPRKGALRFLAAAGAVLIALSALRLPHTGTEYIQLSVGAADCAVLWDRDTVTVIDTGEDGSALVTWLSQRRLAPDRVILTHLHSDHAGGLTALLDSGIPVGGVILPQGAESAAIDASCAALLEEARAAGIPVTAVSRGDTLDTPSGRLTVLWPEAGKVRRGQDANAFSLTLLADLRGTSMLLTGDLDGLYELYAAAPADILKAAHHGSRSASSPDLIAAVAPQVILLSCGAGTRTEEFAGRMAGIPVRSTAAEGALTVRFEEGGAYAVTGTLPQ